MTDTFRAPDVPTTLQPLPEGRLQGRPLFADLVRQSLATAAAEGWPRLVLCDPDFSDWPLGERAVVASLQAWARRGRVLQMLGRDFGPLRLQHPRFVQWRVAWAHVIEVRACNSASADEWPSAIWSPAWTLERIDATHGVMVASREARDHVALAERLDHWWQKGSPSLPPSILGL
ncbi:MAG: hypothetical protein Q7J58_11330 [Hydrogenophaga sp.]|uniref:hypothetical protein n=1 Tax=Hydrogenophaga sp. TaxID=1904254 RepID=UPI00271900F3|nr:hypothetical protein [Hydrogenophaga sp.]MDO9569959.1 hypothetical protein [Hydrogenophaga sp.]MDP3372890.1 hypothetical protein [Hydrogenophaga sp.]